MRNCYVIAYDVADGADYERLHGAIKDCGTWAHVTESTWAIVTDQSAEQIVNYLGDYVPQGSRLFVIRSGLESAWQDVICRGKWLKKYL